MLSELEAYEDVGGGGGLTSESEAKSEVLSGNLSRERASHRAFFAMWMSV